MKKILIKRLSMLSLITLSLVFSAISLGKAPDKAKPTSLTTTFHDAQGKEMGTAKLTSIYNGVKIKLDVKGLTPGMHGIHFHEKGLCEGPEFKSAGNHFNPEHKEHGIHNAKGPHVGDLPNIEADAQGNVQTEFVTLTATLDHSEKPAGKSLFQKEGTSMVIHAKEDDLKTSPSGASGDRIACAVIKK